MARWVYTGLADALATAMTMLMAVAVRGDCLLFYALLWRQVAASSPDSLSQSPMAGVSFTDLHWYILGSVLVSYSTFFALCGYLHWYYYRRQKDRPELWKCQPERWLSATDARHEVMLGSVMMGFGGTVSGVIACYVLNGGNSELYYSVEERGWPYLILSVILTFVVQDFIGYHLHRFFHQPCLYRRIHKWHHRYRSPTPFSGTAMHPVEFLTYQSGLVAPIFFIPIHAVAFVCVMLYVYYYGIVDHSGIKMSSVWPWQPDSMFHDDHHRYFHANFGFNLRLWDRMYGTLRREDRIYGEHIFGGKGRPKKD